MDAEAAADSYISAAAPPGSLDSYMLLFCEPEQRRATAIALALGKVILNVTTQGDEADIRRLKLAWWMDECAVTNNGQPRHPLTVGLSAHSDPVAWVPPLQRLVTGANAVAGIERFDALAGLLGFAHSMAQRQTLLSVVAGAPDDTSMANAHAAGVAVGIAELLLTGDDRIPSAPFDDADRADPGAPAGASEQLAAIAHAHFDAMEGDAAERRCRSAVWLQASLYRKALRQLAANDYDSKQQSLHPLRLLWHAWREARNLRA